jgi:Flp pilus assembly protein TadG
MPATRHFRRCRGAAAVEFAVVAPVVLLFIFGLIVGGLGVFRYQEVAHLAREGARYASTHGGMYQQQGIAQQTGVPAVATSSDLSSYLATKMVLLDPSSLQVGVSWVDRSGAPITYSPVNMPIYVNVDPNLIPPGQQIIENNVRVTVTYQWLPEVFAFGPITLSSTSEMPMSY